MQLFVTTVLLLMLAFLAPPGAANPSGYGYGRYYERQQYRRPFESTDMARDDEQPRENNWNDQIPQAMVSKQTSLFHIITTLSMHVHVCAITRMQLY